MEQGTIEKTIIKQCAASGMPLPDKIKNAPQLLLGLEIYYEAFLDLDSCRTLGMGEGRIPWISIKEYSSLNEFDESQTELLFFHIREMDHCYLAFASKEK